MLQDYGGSPIGNSRVKLTNAADLVERGLIEEGQDPLEVAAEQLRRDGVDVLHTIGGDDTNTTAADLAAFLHERDYDLTVVGLPKTIDNDVIPIKQSLGAWTAAEQASVFAQNVLAEHGSNPRMLIVHEVMGRGCGWLTAAAAAQYQEWHAGRQWVPSIGLTPERWDIHAVFVPEVPIDMDAEADRLRATMDEIGCVNIFLSEGAGVPEIVAALEAAGEEIPRDPFGHVKLDRINPGRWFAEQFAERGRGREDDGPEERLLLPFRPRQRGRPHADPPDGRGRRRGGAAGRRRRGRAGRGARRRAADHRVRPDRRRQGRSTPSRRGSPACSPTSVRPPDGPEPPLAGTAQPGGPQRRTCQW